jgi:hypothetical protein
MFLERYMKPALHSKLLALESIGTQHNPKFTTSLDDLCTSLIDAHKHLNSADKEKYTAEIGKLLSNRFGLKITYIDASNVGTFIGVFVPCENTSIFSNIDDEIQFKDIILKKPKILGTVDTKNAVITGEFSKLPFAIYSNLIWLLKAHPTLTNRELAALLLHEVGHAFTFIEYSDRMSHVNIGLSDIHDSVIKGVEKNKTVYILQDSISILSGGKTPKSTNKFVLSAALLKSIITDYKAELHTTTAVAGFEQVSDQFSSRFGYGRDLVSVLLGLDHTEDMPLHLISTANDVPIQIVIYQTSMNIVFCYLALIAVLFGVAAEVVGLVLAGIIGISLYLLIRSNHSVVYSGDIYDHIFDRVNKIRQDYIDQLKTLQLTGNRDLIKQYVESIKEFDATVKFLKDKHALVGSERLKAIQKALLYNSDEVSAIEAERIIESLTSNKLFVDSARLKLLLTDEE